MRTSRLSSEWDQVLPRMRITDTAGADVSAHTDERS